jgi:hypothetical protein
VRRLAQAALDKWLSGEAEVLADEAEPIQILYSQILAAQGEIDQAVKILQASLHRLEDTGMRYQLAQAQLALAHVLASLDPQASRNLAKHAQAIFTALCARLDEVDAVILLAA